MAKNKKSFVGHNLKLFVFNMIITALCIFAVAGYFIKPYFLSFRLTVNTSEELMDKIVKDEDNGEEAPSDDEQQLISDVLSELGKDQIDITVSMDIPFNLLVRSVFSDTSDEITALAKSITDDFLDGMSDTIEKVTRTVAKLSTKKAIFDEAKKTIENAGNTVGEEIGSLEEYGITEEFVDEKIDQLFDALYADDATVDSVAEKASEIVGESMKILYDGNFISEEDKNVMFDSQGNVKEEYLEDLKEDLKDIVKNLSPDGENININDVMADFLLKAMDDESQDNTVLVKAERLLGEDVNEQSPTDKLKAKLHEKIETGIEKNGETVKLVATIFGLLLLLNLCVWAWIVLKILLRLLFGAKNLGVKIWPAIIFGATPYILFCGLPTLAIASLNKLPFDLGEEALKVIDLIRSSFSLDVSSNGLFTFIAFICLAVISFPYAHIRRKLKRELKRAKNE